MITVEVMKPKIITTFAEGKHTYVKGLTTWKDEQVVVYIYFNDYKVEKKLEESVAQDRIVVETKQADLVESLGLELHNAKLIELS